MKSFKCPNDGCNNFVAFSEQRRWLRDLGIGRWVAVGPRCQKGTCSVEMVPCRDVKGVERFSAEKEKALPFVGNKCATRWVQDNQDGYKAWLEAEERYLKYGSETESDVDFHDAQILVRPDSLWR